MRYLDWKPIITPEEVFSDIVGLNEIVIDGQDMYWLEMRPNEKGRYVIVKRDSKGKIKDVTRKGYNVRNRVHEYGGGSYTVHKGIVYFVNFKDQRLYKQAGDDLKALTPEKNDDGSLGKYASLVANDTHLFFVYEKEYNVKENENFVACLDLQKESEPIILTRGRDFYADPVIFNKKIAWLEWNHPDMPWDATELCEARFDNNKLIEKKTIAGGKGMSICEPKYSPKGELFFVMDHAGKEDNDPENWWNIYRYTDKSEQITKDVAEYASPHWVFGQSHYDFFADSTIIASRFSKGKETLVVIDPKTKRSKDISLDVDAFSSIHVDAIGDIVCVGGSATKTSSLLRINVLEQSIEIIKKNSSLHMESKDISPAEFVSFTTTDGKKAYGYLSMPKNSNYDLPDELPPLLVLAHGGPTSSTSHVFSFTKQFWTSSGYAIIDVDYRGSSGYGRRYRDELNALWGIVDSDDVAHAVQFLTKEKKVDPKRVAIRGGSAGGYMVQRQLTRFPALFSVGASYFGIGNLITLVKETHKFESQYIDTLVGAKLPQGEAQYKDRSPINHLDTLKSPMIIFQGEDDKIVTPENSREMARILKEKGILHEYWEYKEEAHGFRIKRNNVDSLLKEAAFYKKVFSQKTL